MKFDYRIIFTAILGVIVLLVDVIFFRDEFFFAILFVFGILIGFLPIWIDFLLTRHKQKSIQEHFPEFVTNLVASTKSGMPITKAIMHVSRDDYGDLNPYLAKLSNHLEWNIPFQKALKNFARSTGNPLIVRTITTVIEAETAGGNMEDVLSSVTQSLIKIKKLKEKRKANIHSSIVQNYVIFVIFLATMVVVQNLILPFVSVSGATSVENVELQTSNPLGDKISISFNGPEAFVSTTLEYFTSTRGVLIALSMIQGFFAGLILGKMAEGSFKAGFIHSAVMVIAAYVIITTAQSFL